MSSTGPRTICRMHQLAPTEHGGDCDPEVAGSCPPGWYYDDFSPDAQRSCGGAAERIAFGGGAARPPGADLRLQCLESVARGGGTRSSLAVGALCMPGGNCNAAPALPGLVCDAESGTCQMPCATDADCSGAGLGGFVCDTAHPLSDGTAICRDPTCPG